MLTSLNRKTALVIAAVIFVGVSFVFGYYIGNTHNPALAQMTTIIGDENGPVSPVDFSPFWTVWGTLSHKYVGTSTPDDQEKLWGAIQGLTNAYGDPYTTFFPPEENELFATEIAGSFEGVGMEIGVKNNALVVVAPLEGTPAKRAGVQSGDYILKIDGVDSTTMPVDKAVRLIRGKKGTTVTLTIGREGSEEPIEVKIERDVIDIPSIKTETKVYTATSTAGAAIQPADAFVLRLYNFSAPSIANFREALRKFMQSGNDKIIIDLRNNPGGYLEAAVDMASWFLPSGSVVVQEDFGQNREKQIYRSAGYNIFNNQLKVVILVNGGSASASEILSGALREHGKAILVGEKSFGKGSVQELVKITDDTSLKVTIARWLTPNGVSISEQGIKPDVEVKGLRPDEIAAGNTDDPQMQKALQILSTPGEYEKILNENKASVH